LTVAKLIEALSKYPPDTQVCREDDWGPDPIENVRERGQDFGTLWLCLEGK